MPLEGFADLQRYIARALEQRGNAIGADVDVFRLHRINVALRDGKHARMHPDFPRLHDSVARVQLQRLAHKHGVFTTVPMHLALVVEIDGNELRVQGHRPGACLEVECSLLRNGLHGQRDVGLTERL
eukprot:183051-Prymnesium_polylepis.1